MIINLSEEKLPTHEKQKAEPVRSEPRYCQETPGGCRLEDSGSGDGGPGASQRVRAGGRDAGWCSGAWVF